MSVAGATTVIGNADDVGDNRDESFPSVSKGKGPAVAATVKFELQTHLLEETRPFFVSIGKGGVIAALQKLDAQLAAVLGSPSARSSLTPLTIL